MLCTQAFVILLMSEILHEKFFKIIHFKKVNTKKEEEGGGEEEKVGGNGKTPGGSPQSSCHAESTALRGSS